MRRTLNTVIIVVALGFMASVMMDQWNQITAIEWSVSPGLLSLSVLGILLLFFIDAYGWHLVLRYLDQTISVNQSIRIWLLSSLTRYLPGGFWSYLSRASMAADQGVGIAVSSISLYLETLLLITSSIAVGFPAILAVVGLPIKPSYAIAVLLICSMLLHPKVIALLRFVPGKVGTAMASVRLPSARRVIGLYLYYVLFWILFGIVFVGFVYAIYPVPPRYWIQIGASIALAFCVGFVLVFFPGGIGVREATLYFLLLPLLPHTACLLISVGSRLWVMLGEGLSLFLVLLWRRPGHQTSA